MGHVVQKVGVTEVKLQKIIEVWGGLDARRRFILVLASLVTTLVLFTMSKMATSPNMTLLYAGLESSAAGDVVRAIEQRGTAYEVRGGSIYVPSDQRDEIRLTLASEGLPMTGGRGYELLDTLNGFGTTSQMFDAAYWRAKEGELARTIVASAFVSQARVHIANNGSNPFQRNVAPTASVSVVPSGVPITPAQANALRYLVASAVSNLAVEDVSVIDANGALIGQNDSSTGPSNAEDKAKQLRERVLNLVEARVGTGNAVVEVSVDTVTETESIRERRFDPDGRVAISTETEERSDSSKNQGGGDVTVASNLPDGERSTGEGSSAQASETRERVNYEVSETEHEILKSPGAIKRLTVAVLVNGLSERDETGEPEFQRRSDEELNALRELVASAVGFQEDRGDVITIKSMELPIVEPLGTSAGNSLFQQLDIDLFSIIQMVILGLVATVLGLFVIRPLLSKQPGGYNAAVPALPDFGGESNQDSVPALDGDIDIDDANSFPSFSMESNSSAEDLGLPDFSLPSSSQDPVDRLRSLIGERQEETVEILRSWLEESGEKT
ncbi:flagellar basal-body MS-ring/collar protein FliF [Heliomarina baculiformis]|uniref:flagellar basal-body MS-ring/collar protein FliF n=1 Tax=Heliomarina baculiformis TaxID=2872036 RepID=UPI001EE1830B|nr:flagellar basal-body MS-ring/collar protein FliF [Heliomarina baculiformis]